jgi:hypothetical protein
MVPLEFHSTQVFDETKHVVDIVATEYLERAADDTHHLLPVVVPVDGNCLYHSIALLTNNPLVTADELRGMQINFSFISSYNLSFLITIF